MGLPSLSLRRVQAPATKEERLMGLFHKWRRIYRTVRIMAMIDGQAIVDVYGWDLLDGRSEVRLDITGLGPTNKIKPYVEKISIEFQPFQPHPSTRKDTS